ncbi:hypothetical protein [Streptomyces sp. NPDC005125]
MTVSFLPLTTDAVYDRSLHCLPQLDRRVRRNPYEMGASCMCAITGRRKSGGHGDDEHHNILSGHCF